MAFVEMDFASGGSGNIFDIFAPFTDSTKGTYSYVDLPKNATLTIPVTQKPRYIVFAKMRKDTTYKMTLGVVDVEKMDEWDVRAFEGGVIHRNGLTNLVSISDTSIVVSMDSPDTSSRLCVIAYY